MSYTVRPVEIPDFNATWDRAQASRQNALAMQQQQREWQQSAELDNALRQYGPALMGQDATARTNALSALGGMGGRGLAAAAPFHQTEQQRFRTMTPQEVAAAGFRPGTVARVNALGAIQTDQASDVLSPEAERQRLRITAASHAPRVSWSDVKDESGNIIGQRANTGQYNPLPASATNMFGTSGNGLALQYMTRAADAYATGQLQGPDAQRFEAALALYQQPRTQFDQATGQMVTITPPLPPFIAEAIARRGGQQPQSAPPAPVQQPQAPAQPGAMPAAPAPTSAPIQGGMPVGQTGMIASPPPAPNGGVSIQQVAPAASRISPEGHPGDTAAKVALVREGVRAVGDVSSVFAPDGGNINRTAIAEAWGNIPGTEGARLRNLVENAIGNRLRIESGAAASEVEVRRMADRYLPKPYMNDREIQQRLAGLRQYFTDFETALLPGGRQVPAAGGNAAPSAAALRSRYGLE